MTHMITCWEQGAIRIKTWIRYSNSPDHRIAVLGLLIATVGDVTSALKWGLSRLRWNMRIRKKLTTTFYNNLLSHQKIVWNIADCRNHLVMLFVWMLAHHVTPSHNNVGDRDMIRRTTRCWQLVYRVLYRISRHQQQQHHHLFVPCEVYSSLVGFYRNICVPIKSCVPA